MWIFTPTAFVSIVAHRTKPDVLLVRARLKGDLQRLFPGCKVTTTPEADYRFRTELPRADVAAVIADQLAGIGYDNVKGAIPHGPAAHEIRAQAMGRCWSAMYQAQAEGARGRTPVTMTARDVEAGW